MKEIICEVVSEVSGVLSQVDEEQALELVETLDKANRIFVTGEGRSGLIGKAFAMRLMHSGFEVYVTGETITPNVGRKDLLLVVSGSGSTPSILQFVKKGKEFGANIFLVTTRKDSKIAEISDGILVVPAATKKRKSDEPKTIQPLGNQFDQSVHLLLDAILIASIKGGDTAEFKKMTMRHTNFE